MDPRPDGRVFAAWHLRGAHIGQTISFTWRFPVGMTSARITGELRQIEHTASTTVVQLTANDRDLGGAMDEFVLVPETEIVVES